MEENNLSQNLVFYEPEISAALQHLTDPPCEFQLGQPV